MKALFLSLTFFFSLLTFSQKLTIHLFEMEEMVKFSKTTIDSVLLNPDFITNIDSLTTTFVIDIKNNTSTYFVEGVKSGVLPINCYNLDNGLLMVKILEEGFDYGMVINTDPLNESVLWFLFDGNVTTVSVITKFNIEKPL
jgi:hypothetical protein